MVVPSDGFCRPTSVSPKFEAEKVEHLLVRDALAVAKQRRTHISGLETVTHM